MALEQISVGTKEQYIDRPDIPANKKLSSTEVNDIVNKTKLAITQVNTNATAIAQNVLQIAANEVKSNANEVKIAANEEQIALNAITAVLAL